MTRQYIPSNSFIPICYLLSWGGAFGKTGTLFVCLITCYHETRLNMYTADDLLWRAREKETSCFEGWGDPLTVLPWELSLTETCLQNEAEPCKGDRG